MKLKLYFCLLLSFSSAFSSETYNKYEELGLDERAIEACTEATMKCLLLCRQRYEIERHVCEQLSGPEYGKCRERVYDRHENCNRSCFSSCSVSDIKKFLKTKKEK